MCQQKKLTASEVLIFKQRWFLKYAPKIHEQLHAEPDGAMFIHLKKDWSA